MKVYFYLLLFLVFIQLLKSDDYFDDVFNDVKNESMNSIDDEFPTILGERGERVVTKGQFLTIGLKSSILLQDIKLMEEIAHFGRERIPERVVHAKGSAAFGHFMVTNPLIHKYSKASVFESIGKVTPVAVRFSTVTGEMGSADTVFGDMRGFAVKFYTDEGVWDLVSNNVPVFPIRDPQQFSSFIHANKRNPRTGLKDPNRVWDFHSLRPETLNLITYLFSDFGIPNGFRHMPGFSINAFKLVNHNNEHFFAKFHWITNQGINNLDVETAAYLRAIDPDYGRKDLYESIATKAYPSWTLKIQVMTQSDVNKFEFNAFDATKFWPEDRFPLIEVGVMKLNTNANNFFAQTEQLAFCAANLVNGIEPSADKLLAGRLFSYSDSQRYRLGSNHHLIPVNSAENLVITPTQRDGFMRVDDNFGSLTNYYPNSYSSVKDHSEYIELKYALKTSEVFRHDDSEDDNYIQAKQLYYNLPKSYRKNLHKNLAIAMKGVKRLIRERMIAQLDRVDPNYGKAVRIELQKFK